MRVHNMEKESLARTLKIFFMVEVAYKVSCEARHYSTLEIAMLITY